MVVSVAIYTQGNVPEGDRYSKGDKEVRKTRWCNKWCIESLKWLVDSICTCIMLNQVEEGQRMTPTVKDGKR